MKQLTTFLSLLLPQLGPVLLQVPNLITLIRDAFKRVGGTDEELDALLDENKKLIDKLGTPDVYRKVSTPTTAPPPAEPAPGFAYWPETHTTEPDRTKLASGTLIFNINSSGGILWAAWNPELGRPLPPQPPWERHGNPVA